MKARIPKHREFIINFPDSHLQSNQLANGKMSIFQFATAVRSLWMDRN